MLSLKIRASRLSYFDFWPHLTQFLCLFYYYYKRPVVWNPQYLIKVLTEAVTSPCPTCSGSTGRTTPSSPSTRDTGGFIPCSRSTSCTLALSGRSGSGYKTTWLSRSRRTRPLLACSVCHTSRLSPLPVYNLTSSELRQLLNGKAQEKKQKSVEWECEWVLMNVWILHIALCFLWSWKAKTNLCSIRRRASIDDWEMIRVFRAFKERFSFFFAKKQETTDEVLSASILFGDAESDPILKCWLNINMMH